MTNSSLPGMVRRGCAGSQLPGPDAAAAGLARPPRDVRPRPAALPARPRDPTYTEQNIDNSKRMSDSTRRSLQSADVSTCMVLRTLSSYGNRTFPASGPHLWNPLPVQLRNPDITYGLFRRQLKGHIFAKHEHRPSVTSDMCPIERHLLTYLQSNLATSPPCAGHPIQIFH